MAKTMQENMTIFKNSEKTYHQNGTKRVGRMDK